LEHGVRSLKKMKTGEGNRIGIDQEGEDCKVGDRMTKRKGKKKKRLTSQAKYMITIDAVWSKQARKELSIFRFEACLSAVFSSQESGKGREGNVFSHRIGNDVVRRRTMDVRYIMVVKLGRKLLDSLQIRGQLGNTLLSD
jgi:hypothetical protein